MTVEEIRAKARDLQRHYRQTVEGIRNDADLSEKAKTERITAAWQDTRTISGRLRQELQESRQKRRAELQRRLFGPVYPSYASEGDKAAIQANYRAALDRAEQARNPADATALLQRAERTGDAALARAVAAIAVERNFGETLEEYLATRPRDGEAIGELAQLLPNRSDQFLESMLFSVQRPPEVPYNALEKAEETVA